MADPGHSRLRRLTGVLVSLSGFVLAFISSEPAGLLLVVAAATICAGWRAGLVACFASTIAAAVLLSHLEATAYASQFSSFSIVVCGLYLLLLVYRSVTFFDEVYRNAKPTMEEIPGLGWSAYPDGRLRFLNPAALNFVGVTAEEMRDIAVLDNHSWWSRFVHPDDVEKSLRLWRHSMSTGETLLDEQRVRKADGSFKWFRDTAVASRDASGRIISWYGSTVDIDSQKKAEAALHASERRLRQMIDTLPALIWCADPRGRTSYMNDQLKLWTGLPSEQTFDEDENAFPHSLAASVHHHDRQGFEAALLESFTSGRSFNMKYRQRRADGVHRWMHGKAEPLRDEFGTVVSWYGVCFDINDEVEAQAAIEHRERELRLLIDTVPSLIWLMTPEGRPYYFNKRFAEWTGTTPGDAPPRPDGKLDTHAELLHPEDLERVVAAVKEALSSGSSVRIRGRLRRKDGEFRWIESRGEPLRDGDERIIRWYWVSFDVDDESKAQDALRQSKTYLQHLIDSVPVGIALADPAGSPVYLNKRLIERYELKSAASAEVCLSESQRSLEELMHPDDRDDALARMAVFHAKGRPFTVRFRQRAANGSYRWTEGRSEPSRNEAGEIVRWYVVYLDVDDEVRAQQNLRLAAERLAKISRAASLSELSVSIAHQLNQPLQAVVSNSSALQRWLDADPPALERARSSAASIVRDANAAAGIVNRIRALFSDSDRSRQEVDLNRCIEDVCGLAGDVLQYEKPRMTLDLDPSLPHLFADQVQIEQVLMNLIRNAVEAMADVVPCRRILLVASRKTEDDMIEVEVRDGGAGIADYDAIFEPFYTTKASGMGMGLAICRSIVEIHGGRIAARNNDVGASLLFRLPMDRIVSVPARGSMATEAPPTEAVALQACE
ncbi:PAS domain-containing protein [Rhizobium sp. Leaf383]|uniref:PAS domain-containing protein n=1 Tax=Rhizobium sp. Leaf383 TaxID=1736357 RepID=UPI000714E306|nr:PAS domain-containing protein [Rhizobium sp. Leaf383]KQS76411.1 hypothetical protein ASG58_11345 [Rhizobium sp. Leaf383]